MEWVFHCPCPLCLGTSRGKMVFLGCATQEQKQWSSPCPRGGGSALAEAEGFKIGFLPKLYDFIKWDVSLPPLCMVRGTN